jgi:hypothetical protein
MKSIFWGEYFRVRKDVPDDQSREFIANEK